MKSDIIQEKQKNLSFLPYLHKISPVKEQINKNLKTQKLLTTTAFLTFFFYLATYLLYLKLLITSYFSF